MTSLVPSPLLRRLLVADGALCLGCGTMLATLSGEAAAVTALPPDLLRIAGILLLPWGAWVLWLGTRPVVSAWVVRAVVAVNLLWVADSLLLLALGWVAPNALGVGFVLAQAALVAAIAAAQGMALSRSAEPRAAHA